MAVTLHFDELFRRFVPRADHLAATPASG